MRLAFGVGITDVGYTGGISDGADGGLLSSTFLSTYGPYGMAMDFTDASISINDSTDVLDYSSQGTVSATTGALLGPGSKLTYTAPSLKFTEQADGFIAGQAHNLILQSENMQATWSSPESTVTATSASTIRETSATNIHRWVQSSLTTLSGGTYQLSIEIQADGRSLIGIYTSGTNKHLGVDLSAGTIGSISSGFGTFDSSGTITPVGDNWYRLTLDGAGITAINIYMFTAWTAGGAATSNYAGNTGLGLKIRKVHLRRTPSVSTYVATTSAAVYDLPYVHSSGVKTGIMVEPAATNLCLYSWDLTNASNWNVQSLTKVANAGTALDGTETALLVYPTSSGTGRRFTGSPTTTAVTHTMSINAEYSGIAWVYMFKFDGSAPAAWFNVQTGTVGTVVGGYTAAITPTPTGGYRLSVTGTAPSGSSFAGYIGLASSDNSVSVTANGTDGVIFTAAQMETGTVATSPIITYGAAVTRAVDNISMATSLFPYSTSNSVFVNLRAQSSLAGDVVALHGGSAAEFVGFTQNGGIYAIVRTGSSDQTAMSGSPVVPSLSADTKVSLAYATNDVAFVGNGGSVVADASATMPTVTILSLSKASPNYSGADKSRLLKVVAVFPERKADATLQAMTTA